MQSKIGILLILVVMVGCSSQQQSTTTVEMREIEIPVTVMPDQIDEWVPVSTESDSVVEGAVEHEWNPIADRVIYYPKKKTFHVVVVPKPVDTTIVYKDTTTVKTEVKVDESFGSKIKWILIVGVAALVAVAVWRVTAATKPNQKV